MNLFGSLSLALLAALVGGLVVDTLGPFLTLVTGTAGLVGILAGATGFVLGKLHGPERPWQLDTPPDWQRMAGGGSVVGGIIGFALAVIDLAFGG